MTYCMALNVNEGLVMLADTRTNAGVDNVSRFRKMFTWEVPGERVICVMTAGNLAMSQGVITMIDEDIERANHGEEVESILNAPSMFRIAQIIGGHMREMQNRHRSTLRELGADADTTILLAGQRAGGRHRLFMVYSAGNFIEASTRCPYLQIGETKYGKPIIDRAFRADKSLAEASKLALLSFDATIRSNLSVALPIDLVSYETDSLTLAHVSTFDTQNAYFKDLSQAYSTGLTELLGRLPDCVS